MNNAMLTTGQAAEYLGLSRATLEAWRCRGGGPRFCKVGNKAVRYPQECLDSFLNARTFSSTSEVSNVEASR
jgi:excisionase family DNA binding protein